MDVCVFGVLFVVLSPRMRRAVRRLFEEGEV